MNDPQDDIFSARLNERGVQLILRFCRIVKMLLLLGIISTMISVCYEIVNIRNYTPHLFGNRPLFKIQYHWFPYFWLIATILYFVQIYLFWKFSITLKKAIQHLDEEKFNESFAYLLNTSKFGLTSSIMSVMAGIFNLVLIINPPA